MHADVGNFVGVQSVRLTKRIATIPTIVGLTVLGTVLRFAIGAQGGLWRDEALFLAIVRLSSWHSVLDFLRVSESHPPLFYAMMRFWAKLAGDSDVSALALVAVTGGLIVPVTYWIAVRLYSRRVALFAAGVAAFSPVLVEQSAAVRPYPLLSLLVFSSTYELIEALRSGSRKAWAIYVILAAAMLYTHNWTWLVGLGQFVAVASWGLRDVRARLPRLVEAGAAALLILALYSPWLSTLLYQTSRAGHAPLVVHSAAQAVALLGAFIIFGLQSTVLGAVGSPNAVWFGITVLASVLVTSMIARSPSFRNRSIVVNRGAADATLSRLSTKVFLAVTFTAFGTAVLLSTRSMLALPWCIAMLAPGVLLVVIAWTVAVWEKSRLKGASHRSAVVAGIVVLVLGGYAASMRFLLFTDRSNAREVANEIAKQAMPSDLIVVAPQWIAPSFNTYYLGDNQQLDYPSLKREQTVSFSGLSTRMSSPEIFSRTQQIIGEASRAGRRVWLISDAFNIEPLSPADERNLMKEPARVGNVRVSQLRSSLTSLYGPPIARVDAKRRPVRLEEVVALLFSRSLDSAALSH